jgi:hypothetical protein
MTPSSPSKLHRAARTYAESGWQVFPVQVADKTPATGHGFHDSTVDVERIDRWWSTNPDYNVGVATGASRLVVVDLDVRWNDAGLPEVNGLRSWWQLLTDLGLDDEPATFTVKTPSHGEHRYYLAPSGVTNRNSAGKLSPGIDIRAEGGYVVAAPSVRADGCYRITDRSDVAPLPAELAELLTATPPRRLATPSRFARPAGKGYAETALANEIAAVRSAPEGTRNDTLCRAAFSLGQLVGTGQLGDRRVASELCAAALAVGLDESEAVATVRSGMQAGIDNPRRAAG